MTNENQKRLITSALPYVNNHPHLGNIVGCVLSSDVYSRFSKKAGYNTIHICGTDEYGTAIEMAALKEKTHPREICDKNYKFHREIYSWFEIEFDYFGRTTEKCHAQNTTELFEDIDRKGFLEEQEGEQLYCQKCSTFLADRYLRGECPKCNSPDARGDQCDACGHLFRPTELIAPLCTHCGSTPVVKTTKHIFLKLDLLKTQIADFAESRAERWTYNAQEITKEWIKKDLHPRCITRDLKFRWGIPVPKEGFADKVLYVWFDAPIGYISFAKALFEGKI